MDSALLLEAAAFAADRHKDQRRKGADASPYINHPIEVARLLATVGGVSDVDVLRAAILHDTIEDTSTTGEELEARFGPTVRRLVEEVTDDKSLPKQERKDLQVAHAPQLSPGAKLIKLGDKISNVADVTDHPPADWPLERRMEYLDWTEAVVAGVRGTSPSMEHYYDSILARGRQKMLAEPLSPGRARSETVADFPPIDAMLVDSDAELLPPRDILL